MAEQYLIYNVEINLRTEQSQLKYYTTLTTNTFICASNLDNRKFEYLQKNNIWFLFRVASQKGVSYL